jgi:hypothetical protein
MYNSCTLIGSVQIGNIMKLYFYTSIVTLTFFSVAVLQNLAR